MKDVIKELNVERINICEPDGTVKLALFNSQTIPPLWLDNEDILPGHRQEDGISGLMFYNNEGDECGGLIYSSQIDENGAPSMGMSMTFDQYKQDQVLQLILQKEGEMQQYGINIFDRPNTNIKESLQMMEDYHAEEDLEKKNEIARKLQTENAKRMFFGKDFDEQPKVVIYNKKGQEKIKLTLEDEEAVIMINGKKVDLEKILVDSE